MYKIINSAEQRIHSVAGSCYLDGLCCETRGDVREKSERVRQGRVGALKRETIKVKLWVKQHFNFTLQRVLIYFKELKGLRKSSHIFIAAV